MEWGEIVYEILLHALHESKRKNQSVSFVTMSWNSIQLNFSDHPNMAGLAQSKQDEPN
mgnify:CR=1 FL=1